MQLEITQEIPLNVIVLTHFSKAFSKRFSVLGHRLINMLSDTFLFSAWLSPGPDSNAHMLCAHIIAHFSNFLPFFPCSVQTG